MICVICLAITDSATSLSINSPDMTSQLEATLCINHARECKEFIRKWIHEARETNVIHQSEEAKKGKQGWKE